MAASESALKEDAKKDLKLILNLPENFGISESDGGGDCFFHSCAQGLSAALHENYTTQGLRRLCTDYMKEQAPGNWIYNIYRDRLIGKKFTGDAASKKAKKLYQNRAKTLAWSVADKKDFGLDPNSTWGEQEIDGRIICIRVNEDLARKNSSLRIKIHTIEISTLENGDNCITHHLIDEHGETPVVESPQIDRLYEEVTTIHIVVSAAHWEPILPLTTLPGNIDSLEERQYFFPRCEYYTRWQESTHFAMKDSKHWGTYFRSTPQGGSGARYTTLFTDRIYINSRLNNNEHQQYTYGLAGSLFNPFSIKEYEKAVGCGSKEQTTCSFLYDAIIKHKLRTCHVIETCYDKLANKKQKNILKVYFRNKYPCIMVRVPRFQKEGGFDSEGMHAVAMAYYIALVNNSAKLNKIPIELVVRSSFGHNNPSVDVTGNSFRINVGLIPELYVEVLVNSLLKLADMLISNPEPQLLKKFVTEINKKIDKYNNDIKTEPKAIKRTEKIRTLEEELKTGSLSSRTRKNKERSLHDLLKQPELKLPHWDQDLFKVLNQPGSLKQTENTHQSVVLQLTRRREYINLLIDHIMEELDEHKPRFVNPLRKWLAKFDFLKKKGVTTVCLDVSDTDYKFRDKKHEIPVTDEENPIIKTDDNFWAILKRISARLGVINELVPRDKKIKGLYAFLEWANKKYITEEKKESEQGVGSDSDYGDEDNKLFAKKITVMTGMKAINLAHHLARCEIGKGKSYKPLYTHMYYEIADALKIGVKDIKDSEIANCHGNSKGKLVLFDLNYCDSECVQKEKHLKPPEVQNAKVIILDYTSATTTQIREFVAYYLKTVKVILLVNSGLKNEQAGADINPYGTVRIIADTRENLKRLYDIALDVLKNNDPRDTLPAVAHDIRKAYKASGFVVTNRQIFSDFCDPPSLDIFNPSNPPPSAALDKDASPISSAESALSGFDDKRAQNPGFNNSPTRSKS